MDHPMTMRAQSPEGAEPEPYREPWMRGTHGELDPLRRAVVHALELTGEDAERKLIDLTTEQVFAEPYGLPSIGFHFRHIARSLDRLLTYAEGRSLNAGQLDALAKECERGTAAEVFAELREGLLRATERAVAFRPEAYAQERGIGRKQLPTTVGSLLIHCAEHTQRHAGQAISTGKLVRALGGV